MKNYKRIVSLILALLMFATVALPAVATESVSKNITSELIDKVADGLDENDQTNVTLTVPGEVDSLGVDIIYITGAYLSKNQVESDLMVESLYSAFEEIIKAGIPVNFGYVPFSYDDKPVMELTTYKTLEDLENNLRNDLVKAIDAASGAYGGENMENALQVAKNMLDGSPLADHPERQHLIMVATGHTYNFNSGENNEIFSTVPVAIDNSKEYNKLFFGFKAWMQARNKNGNTYPIPKAFTTYNDYRDWDAYWAEIEKWAAADVANGDKGLYKISDTTDDSYTYFDWYFDYLKSDGSHNNNLGLYKSYGMYFNPGSEAFMEAAYGVKAGSLATDYDKVADSAKHAISYERAMWEASNFIDNEITGVGINFYPIYNQMKPAYTNGIFSNGKVNPDGNKYNYGVDWTQQYIGHSFMNMLARNAGHGLEAINNSTAKDKAFFDPIKEEILYTCAAGSYVEDFIGYNEPDQGNFEFIQDPATITMIRGGIEYVTAQIETNQGATASYSFTAPGATEPTFWLDYYYGNGTTTERFIWSFGDYVSLAQKASLTYKLQLTEKATESGEYTVNTNLSATLYPVDSDGEEGKPVDFPVPSVTYTVVAEVEYAISGEKYFDGELAEDSYCFILSDADHVEIDRAWNDENGYFEFDAIKYEEEGEYVYYVTEVDGGEELVVYDGSEKCVIVTVTKENGEFKAVQSCLGGLCFNNYTIAPTSVVFEGVKFFNGLRGEGFDFALEGEDGIIEIATSNKNGQYEFSEITYSAPGRHEYKVYELIGDNSSILYDDRVYDITVNVERIGDELVANVSIEKDGLRYNGDADDLDFRNYSIRPTSTTVSGKKYLDGQLAEGFKFAIVDENGNVIEAVSDENGYFEFNLDYTAAGSYTYEIYEIAGDDENIIYDGSVYEITVKVTLDGTKLTAAVSGAANIVFNNETVPEETTTPPETTEPEPETTEPEPETTEPEPETTEPEPETTEPEPETTEPEPETTEPEPETTEPAPETTEPEPEETEDIPEETTDVPLDPTPETTEPETTEPAPETTEPAPETTEPEETEEITDPEPPLTDAPTTTEPDSSTDTGDNTIFFIAAAMIAVISLAVVATKNKNVED